jgi:homoserine kinase type II
MAVYTDVSDIALESFLADYGLGKLLAYKGIAEGVENSNFLLHVVAGFFILTLYEKRVRADDLPFFLTLMEHLSARGLVCPQPVKNRHGALLGVLAGRPAAIVTFLEGVSTRMPSVAHCAAVGAALASLHRAGADLPRERPNDLSISAWPNLFEQAEDRADSVEPGLAAFLADELAALAKIWPQDLPRGIIHADLFPDNVLFLGNKVSGLIDFYFACTDFLAYDLAVCLNAWCFEADFSFNFTKGKALIDAYQSDRALTSDEAAALPVLARGAAMRFTLTRLVDWLNVPAGALVRPKDPHEYVRRLRSLQLATSSSDLGLTL